MHSIARSVRVGQSAVRRCRQAHATDAPSTPLENNARHVRAGPLSRITNKKQQRMVRMKMSEKVSHLHQDNSPACMAKQARMSVRMCVQVSSSHHAKQCLGVRVGRQAGEAEKEGRW